MRIAILQMTTGIDPTANAQAIVDAAAQAKQGGAEMLFTPEMAGMLDRDRKRAAQKIAFEEDDVVLKAVQQAASENSISIAIGSLPLKQHDDDRWVNRSFMIDSSGAIVARYDKIHMFDVELSTGETWRESSAFRAGEQVVTVDETPLGRLGLAVCYDMRFPALFEALGRAQCDVISIPAAFTVPTGRDHWHVLLRARAIEASAFVIAAAQVGEHEDGRNTYGHSLVVDPWGEVLLDMGGDVPGLAYCDLDLDRIAGVRGQLPSLANRRKIAK
ncbi:MAG: carbon-nitrogen hydrolase family protein [Erythrobacter sp.]